MIKKLTRYAIIALVTLVAPLLQAHFVAYQEWYNPLTGQVLEEYYDVHQTDKVTIQPYEQQKQFLQRAKQHNCLVITEDLESFYAAERKDFTPKTSKESLKGMIGDDSLCPSPLSFLCVRCAIQDIPSFNAECRQADDSLPLEKIYRDEIAAYDDTQLLNEFYGSLHKIAQKLDLSPDHSDTNLLTTCLAVDARILHRIHTTRDKHIMLAAGASHLVRINTLLLHEGWQPYNVLAPETFSEQQTKTLLDALENYSDDSVQDAIFRWNGYLQKHLSCLTEHTLDVETLPLHANIQHAPQASSAYSNFSAVSYAFFCLGLLLRPLFAL